MNKWQTEVNVKKPPFSIAIGDEFITSGSCFSENISESLKRNLFKLTSSPFGIEYNFMSIAYGLEKILNQYQFTESDLVNTPQGYTTFSHHKLIQQKNNNELLEYINNSIISTRNKLLTADFYCITPGTAFVFFERKTNLPVNNCHKLPQKNFERKLCHVNETCQKIIPVLEQIKKLNPKIKFIFSLSPVKHLRDDPTQNSLSKSVCRIIIDEIVNHFINNAYYFPAFEIVTDELRDYRFYDQSMTHPSQITVDYILEKFYQNCLTPEATEFIQQWQNLLTFFKHKPLSPTSEDSLKANIIHREQMQILKNKYPIANWPFTQELFLPLSTN